MAATYSSLPNIVTTRERERERASERERFYGKERGGDENEETLKGNICVCKGVFGRRGDMFEKLRESS